jgi:hypothetical protein
MSTVRSRQDEVNKDYLNFNGSLISITLSYRAGLPGFQSRETLCYVS